VRCVKKEFGFEVEFGTYGAWSDQVLCGFASWTARRAQPHLQLWKLPIKIVVKLLKLAENKKNLADESKFPTQQEYKYDHAPLVS